MAMYAAMRSLVVVVVALAAGCGPEPPPGDPAAARAEANTISATIEKVQYTVTLDGTLYFPASPVNFRVTATPAGPRPPTATRLEVVAAPEGVAGPAARTAFPARWVASGGEWFIDIWNAFPDPDPAVGHRFGRNFQPGPYRLTVGLYEGDRPIGEVGPLEVYLNFVRTRD
jgi:hypothetical protein